MDEFGVEGEHRHIINGHVPVKAVKGEMPIKANGKLMVIDGGFNTNLSHLLKKPLKKGSTSNRQLR